MLVFLTAHAVSEDNKLNFSEKIVNGFRVLVPTSRIQLVEKAVSNQIFSIKGNKDSFARLVDIFNYALPSESVTNGGEFSGYCDYNGQINCGAQHLITWEKQKKAKQQEESNSARLFVNTSQLKCKGSYYIYDYNQDACVPRYMANKCSKGYFYDIISRSCKP